MHGPDAVLTFWFADHGEEDWFGAKPEFDREMADKFAATHAALSRGEGSTWRTAAPGRLAEIIVLDQFSRQLFRGEARAFATDLAALVLAQQMVALGQHLQIEPRQRQFALMPFMHSESLAVHEEAVRLFTELGNDKVLDFELRHKKVLERFGRYPKRNAALGRATTPEEEAYIAERADAMF